METRAAVDEAHGLVVLPKLDQTTDHMKAVRELVFLRPQGLGQASDVIQFVQQVLQLGAVTKGNDRADGPTVHLNRRSVHDKNPIGDDDHVISSVDSSQENVPDTADRKELAH